MSPGWEPRVPGLGCVSLARGHVSLRFLKFRLEIPPDDMVPSLKATSPPLAVPLSGVVPKAPFLSQYPNNPCLQKGLGEPSLPPCLLPLHGAGILANHTAVLRPEHKAGRRAGQDPRRGSRTQHITKKNTGCSAVCALRAEQERLAQVCPK